jgi:hypothetical protein
MQMEVACSLKKNYDAQKNALDIPGAEKKKTAACETPEEENLIFGRQLSFFLPFLYLFALILFPWR